MAKVGDTVRFLNDVGGGMIVRIDGRTAYVRDPHDGFETPTALNELIEVGAAAETYTDPEPLVEPPVELPKRKSADHPYLTAALLFEPHDIRRLSQTAFDLFLVNDSNFKIYFAVASRDDDAASWTLLEAGEAEPNVQAFLGEVEQPELNALRNISVQIVAFKPDEPFELQAPVNFEKRLDLTRLAKLHCFTPTAYSRTPVLTVPVITNGGTVSEPDFAPLVNPTPKPQDLHRPSPKPAKKTPAGPERALKKV